MTFAFASNTATASKKRDLTTISVVSSAALLLAAICFVWWALDRVSSDNQYLKEQQQRNSDSISSLSEALDTTRAQLQNHGFAPVAPSSDAITGKYKATPGKAADNKSPGPYRSVETVVNGALLVSPFRRVSP